MEACQGNSPYVATTVDKYLNNVQYMYSICTVQYESFRYIFTPSFTTVAPRIANNTWHKNALFLFIRQLILQLFFCMKMLFRYAQIRTGYEVQNQKTAKTVVQYPLTNVHKLKSKKILFLRGPFEALRLKKVH